MSTLFRIDIGPRLHGPHSRMVADKFFAAWREKNPDEVVALRDTVKEPVRHPDAATTTAWVTHPQDCTTEQNTALALSDELAAKCQTAS